MCEGKPRCGWVDLKNSLYIHYHDEEWGTPEHDDHRLFEMLLLETFQAGLSWACILKKREAFRAAFDNFDAGTISRYDSSRIDALLQDAAIIRNRSKLQAAVNNAQVYLRIREEFGCFDTYLWGFSDRQVIIEPCDLRTTSPLSDTISADLKKRGMRFVGSTTIYAYLQSVGIINGHLPECYRYAGPAR